MIPLFKVAMSQHAAADVQRVLDSGFIGQGPQVDAFEKEFEAYIPDGYRAILTNSCTSAIHMVLRYLGIGPGDEVLTTPLTCVATNAPILDVGARPVWVDVDPVTGNIDSADALRKKTPRTRAIIAVDWTGRPADYDALHRLRVPVIRDAAHGPAVAHRNLVGDFICYSFGPIKHLCASDGGAVACDPYDADELKIFRWYGLDRTSSADFRCAQDIRDAGMKWHMNDISAAIGRANLVSLTRLIGDHQMNARTLHSLIHNNDFITKPPLDPVSNYWVFPLLMNNAQQRETFKEYMATRGIAVSQVHTRNDKHTAYKFPNGPLPGLDEFDARQINIPCGWWLSQDDLNRIVTAVNEFSA